MARAARVLSTEQRRVGTDLLLIALVSVGVLALYSLFGARINAFWKNPKVPLLLRTFTAFCMQFGLAGLGITVVAAWRRESFVSYGLRRQNAPVAIALCALCALPSLVWMLTKGQIDSYLPFQKVNTTRALLAASFPTNVLGMALTATAWGFFEGFNYAVISKKINQRFPSGNRWLNWGALACAVLCILIHGMVGVTADSIVEMLTTMLLIYVMLVVTEETGNAWGCVFVFVFFWNAV